LNIALPTQHTRYSKNTNKLKQTNIPYSLFRWGLSPQTTTQSGTAAEWSLFQILQKSTGGLSGLLLLFFCLCVTVLVQQHHAKTTSTHATSSSVNCILFIVWLVLYTILLLVFRLLHEISIVRWKKGVQKEQHFQIFVLIFVYLHILSVPLVILFTTAGFCINIYGIATNSLNCIHNDVKLLSLIFLSLSRPVWLMKWLLFYSFYKRNDLNVLARTRLERHFHQRIGPQFLRANSGVVSGINGVNVGDTSTNESLSWTMTFPIISNPSIAMCTICLNQVEVNTNVRDFPCQHRYHVRCIDTWLADHESCPVCLRVIKETTILENFHRARNSTFNNDVVDVVGVVDVVDVGDVGDVDEMIEQNIFEGEELN
jgi:hypothetical protein